MSRSITGDISYNGALDAALFATGMLVGGVAVGAAAGAIAIGAAIVTGAEQIHENVEATKDEIRRMQTERDILMKNLASKKNSIEGADTSLFNSYELSEYKAAEDRLLLRLDDIMKRAGTATSAEMQHQLNDEMNAVINDFNVHKKALNERMEKSEAIRREYEALRSEMASLIKLRKNRVVSLIEMSGNEAEDNSATEQEISEISDAFHDAVLDMVGSQKYSAMECSRIISYDENMKKYKSEAYSPAQRLAKMKRLYLEFDSVSNAMEKTMRDKEEAYRDYYELAFEFGEIHPISDFEKVEDIDCETERLREEKKQILIRQKVMETIDEVMASHGYNVISSDNLVKANKAETRLYGVDDESAIEVFVAKNNKVTMKSVGIGFDENISADEDERLFQKQVSFCSLHPAINKELHEKGIYLSNIVMNPADKKYNKKIAVKKLPDNKGKRRGAAYSSQGENNKVMYKKQG